MATFTIVIDEAPYAGERAWNGLRLAKKSLESGLAVNLFLMADAVYVARRDQQSPQQAPNLEQLLMEVIQKGAKVKVCTTCIEARSFEPTGEFQACFLGKKEGGLSLGDLVKGVEMGTMQDLVDWSMEAEQVISF